MKFDEIYTIIGEHDDEGNIQCFWRFFPKGLGIYEGKVKSDKVYGFGIHILDNEIYLGELKNSARNGYVIIYENNESKKIFYQGEFKHNLKHGIGKENSIIGIYEGEYKNGNAEGYGIYYYNKKS